MDTGWHIAGSGASVSERPDTDWSTPFRITLENSVSINDRNTTCANAAVGKNGATNLLYASNFDFQVPSNSTIVGVETRIIGYAQVANQIFDYIMSLYFDGERSGNNNGIVSPNWPSASQVGGPLTRDYGSASDLWGLTLSPSIVNNTNFGFVFAAGNSTTSNGSPIAIDVMYMKVHYLLGSAGLTQYFIL